MNANHKLAARKTIRPSDLVGETLTGVPNSNSPVLRGVTDRYGKQVGIDLTPDHEALNPAVAISLVASTGGVGLLPLYVRNMLPPHLITRPVDGAAPMIDLVLGYSRSNTSALLKTLLSKIDELKFQVEKRIDAG
jgi:LysR family hca operon transcriptional activator